MTDLPYGRKSDAEILQELDDADNPVTRSTLKNVCVSRLRDSVARSGSTCSRSHPHENMTPECELRTEVARLVNGLRIMAKQKTAAELREEYGDESGDLEEGYDAMVRQARALLAQRDPRDPEEYS